MKCPVCGEDKLPRSACCRQSLRELRIHIKNQEKVIETLERSNSKLEKIIDKSNQAMPAFLDEDSQLQHSPFFNPKSKD